LNTQARFLAFLGVESSAESPLSHAAVVFDAMTASKLRNLAVCLTRSFHFYLMHMRNADKAADGSFRHFRSARFIRTLQKLLSPHNFDKKKSGN
jgi:hypothetical protein